MCPLTAASKILDQTTSARRSNIVSRPHQMERRRQLDQYVPDDSLSANGRTTLHSAAISRSGDLGIRIVNESAR